MESKVRGEKMAVYKLKKKIRESELTPVILDLGDVQKAGWDERKKGNIPEYKEESE